MDMKGLRGNRTAHALADLTGSQKARARHQDWELLCAQATGRIDRAGIAANARRQLQQNRSARRVTPSDIDRLEVVDVDQQHRHRMRSLSTSMALRGPSQDSIRCATRA